MCGPACGFAGGIIGGAIGGAITPNSGTLNIGADKPPRPKKTASPSQGLQNLLKGSGEKNNKGKDEENRSSCPANGPA